ncbi:hypothetical protein M7I_1796 [Glarea lozoyensis 74030]|uniref:Uncharacterized protein n=1 Tax=Glarea lozoyensis (strain ATCC 74030 / MF5533) TaxID=1104152 RepID=H0EH61_GLAL7|nr:hypothetical protein M7I_1796 [Glarea lozoyensis 74030]
MAKCQQEMQPSSTKEDKLVGSDFLVELWPVADPLA